jgi:hypothetical protein
MIAGELPASVNALSPGSGPVNIHDNIIQENLGNDDGGGLRFLMAGNFPMKVYNNMIVNNVTTHEGAGVALDDTPNVDFYNNTVMGNLATATAATSDGRPAPAGLSTGFNSAPLQASLPSGSPLFSRPLLRNNIFWDNRTGTKVGPGVASATLVTGLGQDGDTTPIDTWDIGAIDGAGPLLPTGSLLQQAPGTPGRTYTGSATNLVGADPMIEAPYATKVSFDAWRTNPNFVGALLTGLDPGAVRPGNYHLKAGSPAINKGAAPAPATDIDGDPRVGAPDAGADEWAPPPAPIASVTPTSLAFGNAFVGFTSPARTLTLANTGTASLTGITVTIPAPYSRPAGAPGGTCGTILPAGATCTIGVVLTPTAIGPVNGSLTITGNVAVTGSPVALTGTGVAPPTIPTVTLRDNFNRANANTLGGSWQQLVALGNAGIRVNGNQAFCIDTGLAAATLCAFGFGTSAGANAFWSATGGGGPTFGSSQAAAFTFTNATVNDNALYLKASGNYTAGFYANAIRVRYNGGQVIVETTTAGNPTYATAGVFPATFANGDRLTARATATGDVQVWKTTGATTTFLGQAPAGPSFTGNGRIGMHLSQGARVDNFSGGNG